MARDPTTRTKSVPGPKYDLLSAIPVARFALVGRKVRQPVEERVGLGEPQAEAFIRNGLSALKPGNYVCTVELEFEDGMIEADIYGSRDDHGDWYIKFYVEHGRVTVVSYHEPRHDMTCADGIQLKGSL